MSAHDLYQALQSGLDSDLSQLEELRNVPLRDYLTWVHSEALNTEASIDGIDVRDLSKMALKVLQQSRKLITGTVGDFLDKSKYRHNNHTAISETQFTAALKALPAQLRNLSAMQPANPQNAAKGSLGLTDATDGSSNHVIARRNLTDVDPTPPNGASVDADTQSETAGMGDNAENAEHAKSKWSACAIADWVANAGFGTGGPAAVLTFIHAHHFGALSKTGAVISTAANAIGGAGALVKDGLFAAGKCASD